ncbi:uncharacterized protein A1O9_02217, partial [Exophiala aquamarina CBS 119918]
MSDLEDYAYSPYDDLEDILYDADPAPELADDLAEHALHSPVYLDEIAGYELQEYHSDWEYYSDDYMDDDSALENRDFVEHQTSRKRGKKRKLVETKDIPELDLNETKLITRSIKGTVWARPGRTEPPTHTVGQGDRISLMKNWRQVFSIKDDGWGRRTDVVDNDESWAKDLGLADMGLQPQRQKSFEQEPVQQDDDEYEEEGSVSENEDYDEDIDDDRLTTLNQVMDATIDSSMASDDENPRKRRRLKPGQQTPPTSSGPVPKQHQNGSTKPTYKGHLNGNAKTKPASGDGLRTSKKRKASEEPSTEHDNDLVLDEPRRAKRIAARSTNGSSASETSERRSRRKRG